jgi:hypothetical protein
MRRADTGAIGQARNPLRDSSLVGLVRRNCEPTGAGVREITSPPSDTRFADPLQGLFGVGEGTPFHNFTDSFHGLM